MIYDWSQLDSETITNLFLYGSAQKPADLTNDAMIRAGDANGNGDGVQIEVDALSYMTTGLNRPRFSRHC